jgi:signal transduction histidine kinase/ActR/RegA family two-component response regulator
MSTTSKHSILYIEDDRALARLVQKHLEHMGYIVDLAGDFNQGLKHFQASNYDVLIVDQTLPGGDGLELVRKIAMLGSLPPAIMLTGTGNEATAVEAMKLGMSDYLVKDLEGGFLNLLPIVIENALHQRQLQDERFYLERELALRSRIADIFITCPLNDMFVTILDVLVGALKSKYGVFSYLDEDGAAILAGIKTEAGDYGDILGQCRRVPRETWADSPWGIDLLKKKSIDANDFFALLLSREPITRSLFVPIVFQDEVIGFIGVANKAADYTHEEQEMLEKIACYIASLLDAQLKEDRQEKKRRLAEEELRNLTRKLNIKVKVMHCLREISELFQNPQLTEGEILQGVVNLAPTGWQFPEITCVRIDLKGKLFQTANYQDTPWKSSSPIYVDQEIQGNLEVCYSREKAPEAEGPFLEEECVLLDDIADRLGTFIQRKQIERELAQAHRLEAVGQLASGIAHEISTPTQYVGDNIRFLQNAFNDINTMVDKLQLLLQAAKDEPLSPAMLLEVEKTLSNADLAYLNKEIPTAIDQSLQGVDRVAAIVRAMKVFSHPGNEQKQAVDLARAIENALTISRNEWKYVADIVTDFDPNLPMVACLPGELNQVILNLIVNAAQAIADKIGGQSTEKGAITIRTRQDGRWAEIRVEDTGIGIDEQFCHRLFDPFFTTKAPGKGTGQGLFIAHNIITKKHGGTIDFQTHIGQGTEFVVRLPIREEEKGKTPIGESAAGMKGGD